MITTKAKNNSLGGVRLFGNTRVLVISGMFIAMSIILGKFCKIPIGDSIRISFENLPILMAGLFFGPLVGCAVAVTADVLGCILYGYTINPIITLGAACIGIAAGLVPMLIKNKKISTPAAIYTAHVIGSMIVKSIGLYIYFQTPIKVLLARIPLYIGIGSMEFVIISLLFSNKSFMAELRKIIED